jgi:hypothetical protein
VSPGTEANFTLQGSPTALPPRLHLGRPSWCALAALLTTLVPAVCLAAMHTVIITGQGGEPEYEKRFREQTTAISGAARKLAGDNGSLSVLDGPKASRDVVRAEFRKLAAQASPEDQIMVVLIGHGTYDGEEYKLNIPGRDLTAGELLEQFDLLRAKQQLIINATSASGATLERWRREGRVVISATKNGGERTATRFLQFWVDAVTSAAADTNKDDTVTAAEAFAFANRRVGESFKADVALATEHARMEGNAPERFQVARLGNMARQMADPAVSALMVQRARIEQDLEAVKRQRSTLATDAYYDQLESVLLKLATLQKEIDAKTPRSQEKLP